MNYQRHARRYIRLVLAIGLPATAFVFLTRPDMPLLTLIAAGLMLALCLMGLAVEFVFSYLK